MLAVEGLSASYGRHRALRDVALEVGGGEIVTLLGGNGAGKSTLLAAIAGLHAPEPGATISMRGTSLIGLPPFAIVEHGIALVPQGRGIFGDLTVAENLALGAYARRARAGQAGMRAAVLELFPRLGERPTQIVRTMSGGERQMVAIGRALMSAPDLLLLDELSLGLSPLLCRQLFASLQRIRSRGTGILLVEQNARQALRIADRGYLLENGRIVGHGLAGELASDTAVQRAYLGLAS